MRNKIVSWSILAVFLAILGAVTTLGQPAAAKLRGLLIFRDDQNDIKCSLVYKGIRGRRRIDATAFCQANLQAVKALGKKAFDWALDNPVDDPAVKAHLDALEAELEAAGYEVNPP